MVLEPAAPFPLPVVMLTSGLESDAPSDHERLRLVRPDVAGSDQIVAPAIEMTPASDAAKVKLKRPVAAVPIEVEVVRAGRH